MNGVKTSADKKTYAATAQGRRGIVSCLRVIFKESRRPLFRIVR
jgi:hypothetical protein